MSNGKQYYNYEKILNGNVYLSQFVIAQKIQNCYGSNTEFFIEF